MKKLLVTLVVAALCVPAMADVQVTAVANGQDIEVYLANSDTEVEVIVRGVSLVLDAAEGMTATGAASEACNAFPDYYNSNSGFLDGLADETELPGDGAHPMATIDEKGEGVAAEDVALSMGILDNSGEQGGLLLSDTPVLVATVTYTGGGEVCLGVDELRGGIVGQEIGEVTYGCATIVEDCIAAGHVDYTEWDSVGKPEEWCNPRQCHGDADGEEEPFGRSGTVWVGYNDISILVGAFQKPTTDANFDWAADFNRRSEAFGRSGSVRVGYDDISELLVYFQKTVPVDCND